jgi:hypothetical protein
MLHHLMNTNRQNKLYYGSSDLCPCCHLAVESFSHVLSCCDPSAATNHESAFAQFMTALSNTQSPLPIIEAVKHGTKHWLDPGSNRVRALTAGSLHPGDTLLTTAFQTISQYRLVSFFSWLIKFQVGECIHCFHG